MNTPPNYTRRMLWVFVGQMMLIAALFVWSDVFPSWVNRIIVATVILFPPMAYLTVLAQPSVRQAWRSLLRDLYLFAVSVPPAVVRLFSFATVVKLVRLVASLKPFPETMDDWIAFILFPFKTYIVVAVPFVWVCLKFVALFHQLGREVWELGAIIYPGYVFSLLVLLPGALIQAFFCRAGSATMTLLFFVLGILCLML